MRFSYRHLLMRIPPGWYRDLPLRLTFLFLSAAAVALIWWSLTARSQVAQEYERRISELFMLESKVQQLELGWNPENYERVLLQFEEAGQFLFNEADEISAWLGEADRLAQNLGFSVSLVLPPAPQPATVRRPRTLPVTFDLRIEGSRAASSYERLLSFIRDLTLQEKKQELVRLQVRGQAESIQQANLRFQLWTAEDLP